MSSEPSDIHKNNTHGKEINKKLKKDARLSVRDKASVEAADSYFQDDYEIAYLKREKYRKTAGVENLPVSDIEAEQKKQLEKLKNMQFYSRGFQIDGKSELKDSNAQIIATLTLENIYSTYEQTSLYNISYLMAQEVLTMQSKAGIKSLISNDGTDLNQMMFDFAGVKNK